jgi:hypothetical protein
MLQKGEGHICVPLIVSSAKYVCIEHHYSSVALLKKIHKTVSISKAFG